MPLPPTEAPTDELPVSCEEKVAADVRRAPCPSPASPLPLPPTEAPTDELPVSCEEKVAAAVRRGNYLYLFGEC